ncbi:MAG: hypothetical protein VX956_02060 [Gemmatimonadota bacterium]|nr:hypothetical protein [Gemmatimonadota bacterium]
MHCRPLSLLLLAAALLTACASAGDRLNEGMQLQAEGRYMEAAYRYADAVDKDETLTEAHERLGTVAASALQRTMDSAEDLSGGGDPIAAADALLSGDRLLRRIRDVGARFTAPQGYDTQRRETFDRAIAALMSYGELQRDRSRFADARRAFIRARNDFAATRAQREASFNAEADLLLRMADAALSDGANRRAYGYAGEVLDLVRTSSRSTADRVGWIQETALRRGTVRLAVLPISTVAAVRENGGSELAIRLSDDLELDYWRDPPPFVAVADPVLVRRAARIAARGANRLSARGVERVIGSVDADLGALIEFSFLQVQESNVETELRSARTNRGDMVSYSIVKGRVTYQAMVQVILVDADGDELTDFNVSARETGRFERGAYRGNPRELDLGRNEARLFAPDVIAGRLATIEQEMLTELAANVADRLFDRVLSRVR